MTSLIKFGVCAAIALCAVASQAQDKKADPNGTWKWSGPAGRNGNPAPELTLKLKTEGTKLTGTLTTPGRGGGDPIEAKITDGKFEGDKVSFAIVRENPNSGMSQTNKYEGKVEGDTIKGTQTGGRRGGGRRNGAGADTGAAATPPAAPAPTPWEAKRSK